VRQVQAERSSELVQFYLMSEGIYRVYNLAKINFDAALIQVGMSCRVVDVDEL
jgi:hypothetical protein